MAARRFIVIDDRGAIANDLTPFGLEGGDTLSTARFGQDGFEIVGRVGRGLAIVEPCFDQLATCTPCIEGKGG